MPSHPPFFTFQSILLFSFFAFFLLGCSSPSAPPTLGPSADRLPPCPESPNCVSSQSDDPARRVEPLRFAGAPEAALARLRGVLAGMERCALAVDQPPYLRAEFRSRLFGFVDDVEFLLEADAGVIHLRSAARVGWWDMGVNRKRVEEIRALFNAASS